MATPRMTHGSGTALAAGLVVLVLAALPPSGALAARVELPRSAPFRGSPRAVVEMQGGQAGAKGFGVPQKRASKRAAAPPPNAPPRSNIRRISKGVLSPMRTVPPHIPRPDYADTGTPGYRRPVIPWDIEVKGPEAIAGMRAACKVAREVLDIAGKSIAPGVCLDEIDRIVHEEVRADFPRAARARRTAPVRWRAQSESRGVARMWRRRVARSGSSLLQRACVRSNATPPHPHRFPSAGPMHAGRQ